MNGLASWQQLCDITLEFVNHTVFCSLKRFCNWESVASSYRLQVGFQELLKEKENAVAMGPTGIVADAYGNNTVTNPNSSDPPVKLKNMPNAKPSILGVLRSLLSDPKTYAAVVILAGALFNSGLGIAPLVTGLLPLMAVIKLRVRGQGFYHGPGTARNGGW